MRFCLAFLFVAFLGFLHARSIQDEELEEINDTIVKINIGMSEIEKAIEKAKKIKEGGNKEEEKEKGGNGGEEKEKGGNGGEEKEKGGNGGEGKEKGGNKGGNKEGGGSGKEGEFDISDHIFEVNEHEHKEDDLMEGDILISKGQDETYHGIHGDLVIGNSYYWPSSDGGKHVYIPYSYHRSASSKAKAAFQQAVKDFGAKTCIRFIPRRNQRNYINLISGRGCYSWVGKQKKSQLLSLGRGCETKGIAIHELMHAIGYYHEQSRRDRDRYVTIDFNQIRSGRQHNFLKRNTNSQGTAYDYNSVMHYGAYAFAKSNKPTIRVKKRGYRIGQRTGFSSIDLISINAKYCARSNCYDKWRNCHRYRRMCKWWLIGGFIRRGCRSTCKVC